MDIKENWREITISEMAELMQSCNTDHSAFWTSFAEDFETAGKAKINRVNQITLQASMIYFLTTVAALQEKANGQAPSLEELKSIYHLARFANNDSSKGEYWYYRCLASTININTEVYKNINLGDTKQCQMFVEQFYNAQLSPFIRTIEENPVEVSLDRFLNILIKESPSINDQEPLSVPLENLRKFLDENWGAWIQGKTIYQCTTQLLTDEDVFEFSQQIPNDSYHATGFLPLLLQVIKPFSPIRRHRSGENASALLIIRSALTHFSRIRSRKKPPSSIARAVWNRRRLIIFAPIYSPVISSA